MEEVKFLFVHIEMVYFEKTSQKTYLFSVKIRGESCIFKLFQVFDQKTKFFLLFSILALFLLANFDFIER